LSVTRHHVESYLRVEDVFWERLERKQVHSLLVQFVHPALSVLRGRLENRGHGAPDRSRLLCSQQKERQRDRDRMRRYARARLQFWSGQLASFALAPHGAHAGS